MLTVDELRADVESGAVDTVIAAFTDMQGRLMGKRLDAEFFLEELDAGHEVEGCNYLLALEMEMDPVPGYALASWERGYGDFGLQPDLGTLRRIPWHDATALVLCDVQWHDGWPVQHEINFRYADALKTADDHVIYKTGVKELAHQCGMSVTFMAKPDHTWVGSSCHIHSSLWRDGRAAFAGESDLFRQYLAGQIAFASELAIFFAPTINSYKRFAAGSWAPTTLAWAHDNRTCGFRIVGHGSSLRPETRIPGADANPYLAFAALLASGLHGIEQGLELEPALEGNAYESGVGVG